MVSLSFPSPLPLSPSLFLFLPPSFSHALHLNGFLSRCHTSSQQRTHVTKVNYSPARLLVQTLEMLSAQWPTFFSSSCFSPILLDGRCSFTQARSSQVANALTSLKYVDCFPSCRRQEIGSHTRDSLAFSVTPHALFFLVKHS